MEWAEWTPRCPAVPYAHLRTIAAAAAAAAALAAAAAVELLVRHKLRNRANSDPSPQTAKPLEFKPPFPSPPFPPDSDKDDDLISSRRRRRVRSRPRRRRRGRGRRSGWGGHAYARRAHAPTHRLRFSCHKLQFARTESQLGANYNQTTWLCDALTTRAITPCHRGTTCSRAMSYTRAIRAAGGESVPPAKIACVRARADAHNQITCPRQI